MLYDMTDAEYRDWETRQMDRLHAELDAERDQWRESHLQLQKVRRVLRTFMESPISLSALQPVMALAMELNESLRDKLEGKNGEDDAKALFG